MKAHRKVSPYPRDLSAKSLSFAAREQNVNDTIRQITTAVQRLLEIRE